MRFSERIGVKPSRTAIQIDSMDAELRNSLWNVIALVALRVGAGGPRRLTGKSVDELRAKLFFLWIEFFKMPVDALPYDVDLAYQCIRERYFKLSWNEVYDLLESIARNSRNQDEFCRACNRVLSQELSAYRFVNGLLVPITSSVELSQVGSAMDHPLASVGSHLKRSAELLSKRPNPDCRNAIKEAISAVEAMCRAITGDEHTSLGEALDLIEKQRKVRLHSALKEGFKKLYGYASNADGIRHDMLEEPNLGVEDAVFWLVVCSAFVNYLTEKARRSGISLTVGEGETTKGD